MNKKDLSEAIEEGILKGFWKPIIIAISVWAIVLIIMAGIFVYESNRQCGKDGCQVTAVASIPDVCNYPHLDCKIYEEHRYFNCEGKVYPVSVYIETSNSNISGISLSKSNESCADVSDQIPLISKNLCGYQESNAWFIQFKENYNGLFNLKMECR